MGLWQLVKIFGQQHKVPILVKVLVINILLLTLIIPGVEVYQHQQAAIATETSSAPLPNSFINIDNQVYFMNMELIEQFEHFDTDNVDSRENIDYHIIYQMGLFAEGEISYFDMLGVWTRQYFGTEPRNNTWLSFDLMQLDDNYLGVWMEERVEISYQDRNQTALFNINGYPTDWSYRYYLIVYDLDQIKHSRETVKPAHIMQMEMNETVQITEVRSHNNKHYLVLSLLDQTASQVVVLPNLDTDLKASGYYGPAGQSISNPNLLVTDRDLTHAQRYFEQFKLHQFDLQGYLYQQHNASVIADLPTIELHNPTVQLIDTQDRLHITGVGTGAVTNTVEGNYTGQNQVDYVLYNPETQITSYWDLFPSYSSGLVPPTQISQVDNEVFLVSFVGPSINQLWGEQSHWDFSPSFDQDKTLDLKRSTQLQASTFTPASPSELNYIQFNQDVSQTDQHTITYPRLYESLYIPGTHDEFGGTLGNPFQFLTTTTDSGVAIYALLHDTTNGYTQTDWHASYGKSLVRIDLSHSEGRGKPELDGMTTVIGPRAVKDIEYGSNANHSIKDFEGFHIERIYHIYQSANDGNYIFLRSTTSGDNKLTTNLGLTASGFLSLHVTLEEA